MNIKRIIGNYLSFQITLILGMRLFEIEPKLYIIKRSHKMEGGKWGRSETDLREMGQLQSGYALLALPHFPPVRSGETQRQKNIGYHLIFSLFCFDNGGNFNLNINTYNKILLW
ncbi:MAG: hypothetical protein C4527_04285 [Candidatus Omnitrophota bacterium]|nr:MAG: hypothetical protein C4527_04285 [Candidatus Omnitrophota bacterium]